MKKRLFARNTPRHSKYDDTGSADIICNFETKVERRQIQLETEKQQAILHASDYNVVLLVDFKNFI